MIAVCVKCDDLRSTFLYALHAQCQLLLDTLGAVYMHMHAHYSIYTNCPHAHMQLWINKHMIVLNVSRKTSKDVGMVCVGTLYVCLQKKTYI